MDTPKPARQIALDEDPSAIFDHFYEEGWTDGLPIIPPTEERVAETLRFTDYAPQDVVALVPPGNAPATVENIAINAVMAGCKPEYLPVLIAAVGAMTEPAYNLYGRQTTTHPGAHLMIVHGPARNELEVNCRQNVFGQGRRANATLGRAVRLLMMNVGGGIPGVTDMATHGHPGKYSYTIGEDEEGSPWPAFHADRGFAPDTSAVTMLCAESPHNVNDLVSKTAHKYLGTAASAMSHLGANGVYRSGLPSEQMLVLTAEAATWLSNQGWSKADVSQFIFETARQPIRLMRDRGGFDMTPLAPFVNLDEDEDMAPIVPRPEDILIVIAGGHGRHMQAVLTASYNLSVTKAITRKDGTPVGSVREFVD